MQYSELKVLIVDSAQSIRIISKPILVKEMGFLPDNILEANDGRHALNILQTEDVDLVLSEWDIPEISGIELLKLVRSNDDCQSTDFVFVTSNSDQRNILEAVKCKVSQYIVKPFSADSFIEKLSDVIDGKNRRLHKRHSVKSEHDLQVLSKDRELTTGHMVNLSKGGLLAKLVIHRGMTVTDILALRISVTDKSGKKFVNVISGELVRIEKNKEENDSNFANYAFAFLEMDMVQKNFIDQIIETRGK